ncbi:gametocyte-specific factor 1-like isoform X2 [Sceloporus undulatus]|uniref:gametocyte-specific factor 1-like isoform X2 n=1 Tax=Sceloporus undulatus TaxID=8520 RepID=UPI001C4AF58E|nr:gametocyte-specific factor 1-like isoform X2 [Sceloporus undulatus]
MEKRERGFSAAILTGYTIRMTSLNAEENKSPDPETLLQCPYDKNHQIRACRFPYHLVKCRKNNQTVAKQLVACPYNARHRIPKEEFNSHIETCENKVSIEPCEAAANKRLKEGNKEKTAWQCPPPKEDWEADAEEAPARPFVFGASITRKETYNPVLFSNGMPGNRTKRRIQD